MPFGMGRRARSLCVRKSVGMSLPGQGSSVVPRRPYAVRCGTYDPPIHDVGGAAVTGTQEAEELLLIEEADSWFEYLEATRGQTAVRYREVEPWAWARLTQRLRAIRARRAKLRPAAA
jgi:hypothetical protein